MNFIKLTEACKGEVTFINFEKVCEIRPMKNGGARIYFDFSIEGDVEIREVKETPEQILEKL